MRKIEGIHVLTITSVFNTMKSQILDGSKFCDAPFQVGLQYDISQNLSVMLMGDILWICSLSLKGLQLIKRSTKQRQQRISGCPPGMKSLNSI